MNRFCCTSYNRYCNVALATIAFILVCLIDVKTTAQTTDDTNLANMTSNIASTSSSILVTPTTNSITNFTNGTTIKPQQQTTSQTVTIESPTSSPSTIALPKTTTTTSIVAEEQSNFVTNAAQPLVMTTSSNSTVNNENDGKTSPLLPTTTRATTTRAIEEQQQQHNSNDNNNNKSSSSSRDNTNINNNNGDETASTSSYERTTTFRPFIVPTLPALRPRIANQRPYSKHHHDHHWGPFFEEPVNGTNDSGALQVGFHLGTEAILNCRVGMLKDKTVMWIQRTTDKVSLLTVGNVTYSGDPRIGVKFQYPNNWRLHINPIRQEDAGLYMCQVSTHPPKVFATNLTVLAPAIRVVDEMGHDVNDRYYKLGSLIDISCQVAVSYLATLPPAPSDNKGSGSKSTGNLIDSDSSSKKATTDGDGKVMRDRGPHYLNHKIEWKKDGESLPGDVKISLSTSKNWKNSRLTILHAYQSHSGMYSCSVYNTSTASAHVQVLNGETPAAVQHNSGCGIFAVDSVQNTQIKFLSSLFLLLFTTFYANIGASATLTTGILVTMQEIMFVV
ncbi:uncharacterized protein LOC134837871 [Culicoides brevitarsis]|uniref:uncharacterized protein LOC134837871 n=1 Tax=Culicoides brevitarsis TaxID=469753 RepID=UPI00307C800E